MDQEALWHDTLEDALRDLVHALGGPKKVGHMLWPSKVVIEAGRLVNHCLDPERPEKLSLDELVMLLRAGGQAGCHVAMSYLADACCYSRPTPVSVEDKREALQREFIASVERQQRLADQMKKLAG